MFCGVTVDATRYYLHIEYRSGVNVWEGRSRTRSESGRPGSGSRATVTLFASSRRGVDVTDDQKRAVRDGYDEMAAVYDDHRSLDADDLAPLEDLREFLDAEGRAGDGRLLDLGCGAGRGVLEGFADRETVGLDFSRAQLDLARERVESGLVLGDMTGLPFTDDAFDAVTAFYSVIHLPTDQHRTVYEEVVRVLRPGGTFVLSIGDDWAGSNDDWLDSGARMEWSFPSLAETERTLEAAGLPIVERYDVRSEMDADDWPFLRCRLPTTEE